jgi:hypothetical protein
MVNAETVKRWALNLGALARVLAFALFVLFAFLLWQTIEIGSATTSFQRATVQITTLETSQQRLLAAQREAEQHSLRFDIVTADRPSDEIAASEARRAAQLAATDYEAEANKYYLAVCDAGNRLAAAGRFPRIFIATTSELGNCPERTRDLAAGATAPLPALGTLTPEQHIQEVRVVLDYYTTLANSYILPILFGMLGALVFALRDMITSPENMEDFRIVVGYVLRLFLGAIFGLIIGYVNISSTAAAGLAASPLLLSLVAGFSTDAVISILDRVAAALSYDKSRIDVRTNPEKLSLSEPAPPLP